MLNYLPRSKEIIDRWLLVLDPEYQRKEEQKRRRVAFGSCLPRTTFPQEVGKHKLGSKTKNIGDAPHRGPGLYQNDHINTIKSNSDRWIVSKRGYTYPSRTGPRIKKEYVEQTPCPTEYQTEWSAPGHFEQAYQPFLVKEERLKKRQTQREIGPGPGVYNPNDKIGRRVRWPERFGGPIYPIEPNLPQRTLKTELMVDKEYRKFKNKVAYFRLYN